MISIAASKDGKREVTIDITKFDSHAPVLVSSYRETIRLVNSQVGTRRAIADTVISDGKKSYLLRKGSDVQMPSGVPQTSTTIWGPNASDFDARRFFKLGETMTRRQKRRVGNRRELISHSEAASIFVPAGISLLRRFWVLWLLSSWDLMLKERMVDVLLCRSW